MARKSDTVTLEQKLATGGLIDFRREFCPWIGVGVVFGYQLVKSGEIRLTKIGRRSFVAAADATAFVESRRAASRSAAA